jgi:HK97 family phage prohead protease
VTEQLQLDGRILSFDEDKREVEVFLLPWDTDVEQSTGVHRFERGSFKDLDPARFRFRQRHQDPPTGKGIALTEEDDGPHMRFKVSNTRAGDEQLALIRDGVEDGVSVAFDTSDHRKERLTDGRTRYTHTGFSKARALEVSTTWMPAYPQARVLAVMEASQVAEDQAPVEASEPEPQVIDAALKAMESAMQERFDALQDRIAMQGLKVPDAVKKDQERMIAFGADVLRDKEAHHALLQAFEVDEVISSDNLGVIPEMRSSTVIGIIDSSRPFLSSTTREPLPPAGETWKFPKITQRPEVGLQTAEKDELASQLTTITSVDFPMATYGGVGDLSLQLIRRSSPSFLNLWLSLLGEQYAVVTDNAAVDDLLSESAVVEGTGTFDPESPSFGEAFSNGATAALGRPGLLPNRIWMSTAAMVAFIDAKSPTGGGGVPLYPGMAGINGLTSGGPAGPNGFNMVPVWVPALDDESVDIIIGPSQGFRWTEDGPLQLSADIPSKYGRDVGLAGSIWFAPIYPAAFTTYALGS